MAKKMYSIYPRTKEAQVDGVSTENGIVNFNGKTVYNTSDEGLVKAVQANHKLDAYAVHDEQLSKAYDSGSWDIIQDSKGTRLKNLHNYTFTATKPKKLTRLDKLKKFIMQRGWTFYFWFWDSVNLNGNKEIGIRFFGVEFLKEYK